MIKVCSFFLLALISSCHSSNHSGEPEAIELIASYTIGTSSITNWHRINKPVVDDKSIFYENYEFLIESKSKLLASEHDLGHVLGVIGGYFYIGESGSNVINIYNGKPSTLPDLVGSIDLETSYVIYDFYSHEDVVFIGTSNECCYQKGYGEVKGEILVLDVSNPSSPELVQTVQAGSIIDMVLVNNYLYTVGISLSTYKYDSETQTLTLKDKVDYPYEGNDEDMYDDLYIIRHAYANRIFSLSQDKLIFNITPIKVSDNRDLEIFDIETLKKPKYVGFREVRTELNKHYEWRLLTVYDGVVFLNSGASIKAYQESLVTNPNIEKPSVTAETSVSKECSYASEIINIGISQVLFCFEGLDRKNEDRDVLIYDVSKSF